MMKFTTIETYKQQVKERLMTTHKCSEEKADKLISDYSSSIEKLIEEGRDPAFTALFMKIKDLCEIY